MREHKIEEIASTHIWVVSGTVIDRGKWQGLVATNSTLRGQERSPLVEGVIKLAAANAIKQHDIRMHFLATAGVQKEYAKGFSNFNVCGK